MLHILTEKNSDNSQCCSHCTLPKMFPGAVFLNVLIVFYKLQNEWYVLLKQCISKVMWSLVSTKYNGMYYFVQFTIVFLK